MLWRIGDGRLFCLLLLAMALLRRQAEAPWACPSQLPFSLCVHVPVPPYISAPFPSCVCDPCTNPSCHGHISQRHHADIVGFTNLSSKLHTAEVFLMLSNMFNAFDKLTDRCVAEMPTA